MFVVVLLVTFYHACGIFITYCSGGGFLFVCLSEVLSGNLCIKWINIYGVWTNNGNTRQYRNKIFCVGCTERTYLSLFFCLCCVVPVSVHYILCLVTVCMKVLQNGRLLRFSDRTDFWCTLAGAYVTKMATIRCIQISSYQGYDDIHKSWDDIIS